jgi:hypothetical protein
MRVFGVLQLCLSIPLSFACVAGFARALPLPHDAPQHATLGLIVVGITAGAGLLFRSDLCAYLAAATNVAFFAGCFILICLSLYDLARPLPLRQYNTDDTPELEALERIGAVAVSFLGMLISTALLWVTYINVRRLICGAPKQ